MLAPTLACVTHARFPAAADWVTGSCRAHQVGVFSESEQKGKGSPGCSREMMPAPDVLMSLLLPLGVSVTPGQQLEGGQTNMQTTCIADASHWHAKKKKKLCFQPYFLPALFPWLQHPVHGASPCPSSLHLHGDSTPRSWGLSPPQG